MADYSGLGDHATMKVAVVGAGFAGVSACYVLSRAGYEVTLFDEVGIAGGASGASPGLLHPYPGRFPTRQGEAFERACELAKVPKISPIRSRGIIRLAGGSAQAAHFRKMVRRYPDCEEIEGGILLREGVTLDTRLYLAGLFEASGAEFRKERVEDPPFERVVFATGPAVPLQVEKVKGQALVLRWPEGEPPLPYSIIGKKYLVMEGDTVVIGATFEHEFDSPNPDIERACAELLPEAERMAPQLARATVIGCRAGIRAHLPGRVPGRVFDLGGGRYAIGGLGSKGLLSHALLAQKLLDMWQR